MGDDRSGVFETMLERVRMRVAPGVLLVVLMTVGLGVFVARASFEEPVVDFADHAFPAVAWADDRLLVYGGADDSPQRYANEAALIDPVTAEQEMLPDPPFDGALAVPALAADDRHALVLGWLCSDPQPEVESCAPGTLTAARLDLDAQEWTGVEVPGELADARIFDAVLGVTSDGRAVFRFEDVDRAFWTFDLAEGNWKHVPFEGRQSDACLAGDRLVVNTSRPGRERALAIRDLGGDGAWTSTAATPGDGRPYLSCVGEVALVHGLFGTDPVRHSTDPADRRAPWQPTAPQPSAGGAYVTTVATDDELLFLSLQYERMGHFVPPVAYDPERDRWRTLTEAPVAADSLVWGDGALVGFAEDADTATPAAGHRLVRYVPHP